MSAFRFVIATIIALAVAAGVFVLANSLVAALIVFVLLRSGVVHAVINFVVGVVHDRQLPYWRTAWFEAQLIILTYGTIL